MQNLNKPPRHLHLRKTLYGLSLLFLLAPGWWSCSASSAGDNLLSDITTNNDPNTNPDNTDPNNPTNTVSRTYTYYKRGGGLTAGTATLHNGVFSIDGQTLNNISLNVSFVDSVECLAGLSSNTNITTCASPATKPHVMLLCGKDPNTNVANTLLYVLFDESETNRITSSAANLISALQSETSYLGIGVYNDCSGTFSTSWIRNYPNTNFYLWPNVFNTYSSSYVSNLLSTSVIYSMASAGTDYNQYVALRTGSNVFEVWH